MTTTKISPTTFKTTLTYLVKKPHIQTIQSEASTPDAHGMLGNSPFLNDILIKDFQITDTEKSSRVILKGIIQNIFSTSKSPATIQKLFKNLKTIIEIVVPNLGVRRGFYSDIRKYLKDNFGTDSSIVAKTYAQLSVSKEEAAQLKENASKKVISKNKEQSQEDLKSIISIISQLKTSTNKFDKIIAIQLACGLRLNEVLVVTKMSIPSQDEVPDELKDIDLFKLVKLSELSKSHGKNARHTSINPVVGMTRDELFGLFKSVRDTIPDTITTREQATKSYNQSVNKQVKSYFPDKSSHYLRKLYGALSFRIYAKNQSLSVWLNAVLGHATDSLATSANYSTINMKGGEGGDNKELEERVEVVEKDVVDLKEEVKEIPSVRTSEYVMIEGVKIKKYLKTRDGTTLQQAKDMLKFLKDNGITTMLNKHLRTIGFSARVASDALKK